MLDSKRMANTPQPSPTGDGVSVLSLVLARIKEMEACASIGPVGYVALKEDLIARADAGLTKYGTLLRINNGRVAEVDFYQELLDAIMYAMQARAEGKDSLSSQSFELLVSLATRLAVELNER